MGWELRDVHTEDSRCCKTGAALITSKAWGTESHSFWRRHRRGKGSCVPRLAFSFREMEDEEESEPFSLWINPEFSSGQWLQMLITESLAKTPPCRKIHHLFHITKKKQTNKELNCFINQVAFTYLACDFSGWCSKQREKPVLTPVLSLNISSQFSYRQGSITNSTVISGQTLYLIPVTQTVEPQMILSRTRSHAPTPKDL